MDTPYRSTDNGSTWFADDSGVTVIENSMSGNGNFQNFSDGNYFSDELGTQHFETRDNTWGITTLFEKLPGAPWKADAAGFSGAPLEQPIAFGTDRNGYLYFIADHATSTTDTLIIWRRPIDGGKWELDSAGLGGVCAYRNFYLYGITGDRNRESILFSSTGSPDGGIFRFSNGRWIKIPLPQTSDANVATTVSVDSNNFLFAALERFDSNQVTTIPRGIFCTSNNGATWQHCGLDSFAVSNLVSYGDTTYVITERGLFWITNPADSISAVHEFSAGSAPNAMTLFPNPATSTSRVQFTAFANDHVRVDLLDIFGREVENIFDGTIGAGMKEVTIEESSLVPGIYFCRVTHAATTPIATTIETARFVVTK